MADTATRTHSHDEIRAWIEQRGGRPAAVKDTWDGNSGMIRVDFGEEDPGLMPISWDDFFRVFEESHLDFLHQDEIDGSESRFFKFVEREG